MWKLSSLRSDHSWDIELNTRREIPYLQATMYYFFYYINILLTRGSPFNSCFKKGTRWRHWFIAQNRVTCWQLFDPSAISAVVVLLLSGSFSIDDRDGNDNATTTTPQISNWTEWSTIQAVIGRVIVSAKREADLKSRARLLPELYDTRSNY